MNRTIQPFYRILLVFMIGSGMIHTAVWGQTISEHPTYSTIAHEILELEAEAFGIIPNYELLNRLIEEVRQQIRFKISSSRYDAVAILQKIASILENAHFRAGETLLLTETCTPQWVQEEEVFLADCDTYSFLYLGIAEALGLPLRLASVPQHTFIRWHFDDGSYLNWETVTPGSWTDEVYRLSYNAKSFPPIPPEHEIRSLQRPEVLAIAYFNRGNMLMEQGNYEQAIADFTRALDMNAPDADVVFMHPRDADIAFLRGSAWNVLGEYDQAVADFTLTLTLNPHDVEAIYLRGSSWSMKKEYGKALADFSNAMKVDPAFVETYNDMAWLFATCPDEAYRNGEEAIRLAQKAVELRPDMRMYWLDTLAAGYAEIEDFEQAVNLQEEATALLRTEFAPDVIFPYMQRLEQYKQHKPWRE